MTKISETITENNFRDFYGAKTFIEKSAIPVKYGFKSKNGTNYKGYPDFFREEENYYIVVEAKGTNLEKAEEEAQYYMLNNKIKKDIVGIAVASKNENELLVKYFIRPANKNQIKKFGPSDSLLEIEEITKQYRKIIYGDEISSGELVTILTNLNNKFHSNNVRDTDRSLFFSSLMIALTNSNFRNTYKSIVAPAEEEIASTKINLNEAHYLNRAILDAVKIQLKDKINNLSKEFSWGARFSFVETIDIPLDEYKEIIKTIEEKIFVPFQNDEKQDILGKAYRIFLKKAGKIDNRNIILTPDHVKSLMVKLARLNQEDVVIDTCTGSGGFLMSAMEELIKLSDNNPTKITHVKEKQLIGFEIDPILFSLACSNMFLHGDGKTNMLYRSSLLVKGDNKDKILLDYVKSLKPTKCIINPPYENGNPIKFVKQALDYLEPNGKLVIIMPKVTLSQNKIMAEEILKTAKLDFVIKMPLNIFKEQSRTVYTCIFGFTKTPHRKSDEVLFYDLEDDGLVSIQHKGRVDKNKVWPNKEKEILDCVTNLKEIPGIAEKRKIYLNNELVCYGVPKNVENNEDLVKFSDIFDTSVKGSLASEDNHPDGEYNFITASEEWKKHDSYDFEKQAIIYAVGAEGSLGRAHFVNGKFIASNLCLVLTSKNPQKYPVDLEFYSYYLMALKKKIAKDLGDGTSKLTISVDDLNEYRIEYFDIKKQKELKSVLKEKEKKLKELKEKLEEESQTFYNGLTKL
ncbi:MAG: N-6 DNA methylase [Treponema sp.]